MAVVREFMVGNTTIRINDACCRGQTPEEAARILQRVSNIAYEALLRQEMRRQAEKKEKETTA